MIKWKQQDTIFEGSVNRMMDCGHCGSDNLILTDGTYTCKDCGKTYSAAEAEQRTLALEHLNRKRKMQLILMAVCMLFLILTAVLLPGYSENGSNAGLIIMTTAVCLIFFIAALIVRIQFGRERKKLYSE